MWMYKKTHIASGLLTDSCHDLKEAKYWQCMCLTVRFLMMSTSSNKQGIPVWVHRPLWFTGKSRYCNLKYHVFSYHCFFCRAPKYYMFNLEPHFFLKDFFSHQMTYNKTEKITLRINMYSINKTFRVIPSCHFDQTGQRAGTKFNPNIY